MYIPPSAIYFCGGAVTGIATLLVLVWLASKKPRKRTP